MSTTKICANCALIQTTDDENVIMCDHMGKHFRSTEACQYWVESEDIKLVPILSEKEMHEKWDELDHSECCLYQKMSLDFIHKHLKDIDWDLLSINKNLSFPVIDKYPSKINWINLCMSGNILSDTLIYNYRTKMVWNLLLARQHLDLKLLIVLSEVFKKSRAKNTKMFWKSVSRFEKIDDEYVDAYKRFINFQELSKNPNITMKTIDKYILDLDLNEVLKHVTLTPELVKKHYEYIHSFIYKSKK